MAGLGLAGLPIHSRSPQPPSFQGQQQQQLGQMQPLQMQMPVQAAAPPQPVALDAAAIMVKLASIAGEKFKVRSKAQHSAAPSASDAVASERAFAAPA